MNGLSDLDLGLVHLYSGDGKGKTTAAAGLAVRALGAGKTVMFCQFLKGRNSCELEGLGKLGIKVVRAECSAKFMFELSEIELDELKRGHKLCFDKISAQIMASEADLVVLDEILDAVNAGIIAESELVELIKRRPPHVELVLTGRNPCADLIGLSDYFTEFVMRKHPYNNKIPARLGIEF